MIVLFHQSFICLFLCSFKHFIHLNDCFMSLFCFVIFRIFGTFFPPIYIKVSLSKGGLRNQLQRPPSGAVKILLFYCYAVMTAASAVLLIHVQDHPALFQSLLYIDYPLVTATSESEAEILLILLKPAVYQDIYIFEDLRFSFRKLFEAVP